MVTEAGIVPLAGEGGGIVHCLGRGPREPFWGAGNVLYFDLGDDYLYLGVQIEKKVEFILKTSAIIHFMHVIPQ